MKLQILLDKTYKSICKLMKYRPLSFIGFCVKYIYYALFTPYLRNIKGKWKHLPDSDKYYVYFTRASEQLLYNIPHLLTHNKPSFVWIKRNRIIKPDFFPGYVDYLSSIRLPNFPAQIALRRLVKAFKRQLKKNPDLVLHLYTDSIFAMYILHKHSIPETNYILSKYESGLAPIPMLADIASDKERYYTAMQSFANAVKRRFSFWEPIMSGGERVGVLFPIPAVCNSFEILCPNTALIPVMPVEFTGEIFKQNINKASFLDIISHLSPEMKNILFSLVGISKEYYDNLFLNGDNPCLIIVGTHSTDVYNFEANIEAIIQKYSNSHRIFYKPHPQHKVVGHQDLMQREEQMALKHNISTLPADLPLEFLLSLYPDITIGGYISSVFLSGLSARIKFLIIEKAVLEGKQPSLPIIKEAIARGDYSYKGQFIISGFAKHLSFFYLNGAFPETEFLWEGEFQRN